MSTTRNLLQQLTRRAPSTIVPHARYSTRIAARPIPQPPKLHLRPTQTYVQIRWHSVSQPAQPQLEPSSPPKQYDFEDVSLSIPRTLRPFPRSTRLTISSGKIPLQLSLTQTYPNRRPRTRRIRRGRNPLRDKRAVQLAAGRVLPARRRVRR